MSRIYVASLSDYNAGRLHGAWLDLDEAGYDADTLREMIQEQVLDTSPEARASGVPAEEYAVHDYDDIPSSFGEYPDLEELCRFAELYDEHGEAFKVYVEWYGDGWSEEDFQDRFCGIYDSENDYAYELVDELGYLDEMPEHLRHYFDYDSFAHDLFIDGYTSEDVSGGKVAVFRTY